MFKNDRDLVRVIEVFGSVVAITLFLLWLVTVFEEYSIHVAGSREMWIGLIGSLLGGVYTLIGVYATINNQRKDDKERQRLEKMPLLKVDIDTQYLDNGGIAEVFTLCGDVIHTAMQPTNEYEKYPVVNISMANNNPAFDIYIESCVIINYVDETKKSDYYFPGKYRLINDEMVSILIWFYDYNLYQDFTIHGALRVSYSDLYGNRYYQDVPFLYSEHKYERNMSIKNLRQPILVNRNTPPLLEITKS